MMPEFDGALTALEERAEIRSLEALQADRRVLVAEYAPLAAKFKGGTTAGADSARKRHRAGIAKLILADWPKGDKEPSEAALERMANADDRHIDFCEKLENQFAKFLVLENDIADITDQIRDREESLRVFRAELGLAR